MLENGIFKLLDKHVDKFFPTEGTCASSCFHKPNDLITIFFPCHTRDYDWLSKMFRNKFKLGYLSKNFIIDYFKQSILFQEARHKYELKVVEWQIESMKKDAETWIAENSNFKDDFSMLGPDCDLTFRKSIVESLLEIGMDIDIIEEGIEKNVSKWRNAYMEFAFKNAYYSIIQVDSDADEYDEVTPEFKEAWIKMRLYNYYQEHKDSVDTYGEVLPEMKMSEEEAFKLKQYLIMKERERLQNSKSSLTVSELQRFAKAQERIKIIPSVVSASGGN